MAKVSLRLACGLESKELGDGIAVASEVDIRSLPFSLTCHAKVNSERTRVSGLQEVQRRSNVKRQR